MIFKAYISIILYYYSQALEWVVYVYSKVNALACRSAVFEGSCIFTARPYLIYICIIFLRTTDRTIVVVEYHLLFVECA